MLRITKSHTDNAVDYFEKGLKTEGEYYLDKGIISYWQGKTAALLGLEGQKVTKKVFSQLVNNINPNTGDKLKVRHVDRMVTGFDFTISSVKSASILYALTEDQAIYEAHRESYQRMIREIEEYAQSQANTQYGRFYENTGNLIYSCYDHLLSRPVEVLVNGKPQLVSDPNLHSHLFVISATHSHKNDRIQALETFNIFQRAPYFEAVYHNHFSFLLNKAGYRIERTKDRYEVHSVSREIIEKYSLRTKQINQIIEDRQITDPQTKDKIGALSRNKKSDTLPYDKLKTIWKERLTPQELSHLEQIKGKYSIDKPAISAEEAIELALQNHLERNTAIETHKILTYAAHLSYGSLHMDEIKAALRQRGDVFYSEIDTVEFLTTKSALELEQSLIQEIVTGKGSQPPIYPGYTP